MLPVWTKECETVFAVGSSKYVSSWVRSVFNLWSGGLEGDFEGS